MGKNNEKCGAIELEARLGMGKAEKQMIIFMLTR